MAETNQLLLNYYKKEEIKKIKKLSKEKASLKTILGIVDLNYITKEEVLEILGEDYERAPVRCLIYSRWKSYLVRSNQPLVSRFWNCNCEVAV